VTSTKPEERNVLHCSQRRVEPRPQLHARKFSWYLHVWFLRYASRTTDRHRSLIVPNRAVQWEWQNNNYLNKASIPVTDMALWKFVHVFLPVRRYASADSLLAVALCLSVSACLSVTSRCSVEADRRIELVFGFFRCIWRVIWAK